MTSVVIKHVDRVLHTYERMIRRAGEGKAKEAFAAALNHQTAIIMTKVRKAIIKQSSIERAAVYAGTDLLRATPGALSAIIEGTGRHLPLREFKPRQFSYGVRAKVWGKHQQYPSAFLIPRYKNGVYKRLTKKRFPIKQLYGPAIPVEMLRDQSRAAFESSTPDVSKRAMHELARILKI